LHAASTRSHPSTLANGSIYEKSSNAAMWMELQDSQKKIFTRPTAFTCFQSLQVFPRTLSNLRAQTLVLSLLPIINHDNPEEDTRRLQCHRKEEEARSLSFNVVRMKYALVVEEMSRNRLRISCVALSGGEYVDDEFQIDSGYTEKSIAKKFVLHTMSRLESAIVSFRLSRHGLLGPSQLIKNNHQSGCYCCQKSFHFLYRRRHHCRMCGVAVCGNCTRNKCVKHFDSLHNLRICMACIDNSKSKTQLDPKEEYIETNTNDIISIKLKSSIHSNSNRTTSTISKSMGRDHHKYNDSSSSSSSSDPLCLDELPTISSTTAPMVLTIASDRDSSFASTSSSSSYKTISFRDIKLSSTNIRQVSNGYCFRSSMIQEKSKTSISMLSTCSYSNKKHRLLENENSTSINSQYKRSFCLSIGGHKPKKLLSSTAILPTLVNAFSQYENEEMMNDFLSKSCYTKEQHCLSSFFTVEKTESENTMVASTFDDTTGSSTDKEVCLPQLDPTKEVTRLKLMKILYSSACTLIDHSTLAKYCSFLQDAFGVQGAFIATVGEEIVRFEYLSYHKNPRSADSVGTCSGMKMKRSDTFFDYLFVNDPLIVLDCKKDQRTNKLDMISHLEMNFFVGMCIFVRDLPIGCIGIFDSSPRKKNQVETLCGIIGESKGMKLMEEIATCISQELERLIYGLHTPLSA
jgi:hypothetical protein